MKKTTVTALLFYSLCLSGFSQSAWKMQPLTIQTRWAKEVNPSNALPEYPRPQLVRTNWQNLNGLWEYAITDRDAVNTPVFNGKILVPYPVESALSGVKRDLSPGQLLWYRRSFAKPVLKTGEKLLLHFGAVDWQCTIYINGKEAGGHTGGYQPFDIDITGFLKEGSNAVMVKVADPTNQGVNPHGKQVLLPGGIMYTASSGIWQTVWLETVSAAYIQSLRITPDVDHAAVTLTVNTVNADEYTVEATAKNKSVVIATVKGKINEPISLSVPKPHLWSPDDPFLYDLEVKIMKNGKQADIVKSYFGMRKIEIKKDAKGMERIFLNNTYTYNLGTLDQGFWPEGLYTAPTDAALRFDIEAIKAMGFNTIRKHIKIEPARWYYYCDKLGMMVWQDMINPGSDTKQGQDEFEKESAENVNALYNYPSITTWVLFNEGWGAYDQERLTKWMKAQDPSRIVNGHTGENYFQDSPKDILLKWPASDMTDVHAYPPPYMPPYLNGKAMVLGEFGGIGVSIENHLWDPLAAGWGYGNTVSPLTMVRNYKIMVDSLVNFQRLGLSGSIYTQPYDVESEQNGLMTYDRNIIKMPVATIRKIHAALWPVTANYVTATKDFSIKTADSLNTEYASLLSAFKKGKRDSLFLFNLAVRADREKDEINRPVISGEYIRRLKDPFSVFNLAFIKRFTRGTNDPGFEILFKNIEKINAVLGKDEAENAIIPCIENTWIKPYIPASTHKPDWSVIEKNVTEKFQSLGLETLRGLQVFHSVNYNDCELFRKVAWEWFSNYGQYRRNIGADLMNNVCYGIFQQCSDSSALEQATKIMTIIVQRDPGADKLDTYANLLYRLGRTKEALEWEEKAAQSGSNAEIRNNYQRMKKGKKTWRD